MGDSIDKLFNQLTKNIEFTTEYHNQNALKAQITPDCDENCVMQSQIASAKASDEYIKQQFAKKLNPYHSLSAKGFDYSESRDNKESILFQKYKKEAEKYKAEKCSFS